jgi:hypothetical protein
LDDGAQSINVELPRDTARALARPRGAIAYLLPTHVRRFADR